MVITFEIKSPKLISVNEQYMHPVRKCNDGRYRSYVCKAPYLKEVQEFYKEILENVLTEKDVKEFKGAVGKDTSTGLKLGLQVGMPMSEIYEHDISNLIKAVEDCIAKRLKIDDKHNFEVAICKQVVPENEWYLKVAIETTQLEEYQKMS